MDLLIVCIICILTLLATLIVPIFIGSLIIKKIHSEKTIGKNKKTARFIGITVSTLLTASAAWWCSKINSPGLGMIVIPIVISLFTPSVIGLFTVFIAFILRKTGLKEKSSFFFYIAANAFISTGAMPIFCIIIYLLLDGLYNFSFPLMFKSICANAKVEIIESTEPPKGFAIIPEWGRSRRYQESNLDRLLLSEKTALEFIEKADNSSKDNEKITKVIKKQVNKKEGEIEYSDLFLTIPESSLNSQYYVQFSEIEVSQLFKIEGFTEGQKIQIKRTSDNKIIASAEGCWNYQQRKECPKDFGKEDFVIKFVAKTFNLPLH